MNMKVEIKLCIGLFGVCILGLNGDDQDWVYDDIYNWGADGWYRKLGEHDAPIDGIYTISCDVYENDNGLDYKVLETDYEI